MIYKQEAKQMQNKAKKLLALFLILITLLLAGYFVFIYPSVSFPKQKTILLAGDSRSSTDYSFYKEILEKKTGANVLVEGASGRRASYNASNEYFERLKQTHDFSVWLVGGNDDGSAGTVGTFSARSELAAGGEPVVTETDVSLDYSGETFIQAIDHIMRKYKALYKDHLNMKEAPVMIFCTDLPQQRDSKESPWSQQENWERKRLAILECCEKNEIPCLDLYMLCGFDMNLEPIYHEPTDTKTDNGLYYMDGLHPNPHGIDKITDYEIKMIEEYSSESSRE